MKATTLVILAAGLGSRFGGVKQIEPLTKNGETLLDFSIYDAIQSGFEKIVFVVRRSILNDVRDHFEPNLKNLVEVGFVCQDEEVIGSDTTVFREKPFGTGHAVLAARNQVVGNFCVINADDYYGRNSFDLISDWQVAPESTEFSIIGFELRNTLSDFGPVSRGECLISESGLLSAVIERIGVLSENGIIKSIANEETLAADTLVSMNLWGFTPVIFDFLETDFLEFLETDGAKADGEFFLNTVVNRVINQGFASVRVIGTNENWMGITYREDLSAVVSKLRNLRGDGFYPEKLW